ncbi:MAG: hypothetical protein AAB875_03870 [Patescibacteria group bacterium]
MSEPSIEVIVDVEPRNKEFKVLVQKETTIEEVIATLIRRCENEGIKISDWGRSKVGSATVSFVMLRKATGATALAPSVTFGELFPELEERETFKLDAQAQVGIEDQTVSLLLQRFANFTERTDRRLAELERQVEELEKELVLVSRKS